MDSSPRGVESTYIKRTDGFLSNFQKIAKVNKSMAAFFVAISVAVYLSLFFVTGWILATLAGWPLFPVVGLIFLLRLCLT